MKNLLFSKKFNGKLLLTAEYVVLDGAEAIALPTTKFGQYLQVGEGLDLEAGRLQWRSFDDEGNTWFAAMFCTKNDFEIIECSIGSQSVAETLRHLLQTSQELNPDFLRNLKAGLSAETRIDYPRLWGLGSSSTLVAAIADWANIDGFELNRRVFSGSGYDIACATNDTPFLYTLKNKKSVSVKGILPNFDLKEAIFFIYLDKKQNSREGIAHYKQLSEEERALLVPQISEISQKIIATAQTITYGEFNNLIDKHEDILAKSLQLQKVKETHFADFWGSVKSLGAWGGDFVLATSNRTKTETIAYFNQKGFKTVLTWGQIF